MSKRGALYAKLARYSETVLLRDEKDANVVYVVHDAQRRRKEETLVVPQDHTEVIGWFAGREVVRVR